MNLSNTQRLMKLTSNLIANPDLITPWVKQSLLYRGFPVDLELPWWSYRAIEAADTIAPGRRIFEYGTGGSTLRYGKVAKSIVSIEDNLMWLDIMRDRLNKHGIEATLFHHEFDFKNPMNFEESSYLMSIDSNDWDMLIIDGQDESFEQRLACFRHAEPSAEPGDIIIVDDFWRYECLLKESRAKEVDVFESVGPCRIGVTSTAFFHY